MSLKGYYIYTFGCAMNEYDSERLASVIESKGYMPVNDADEADIIILNTCSVREKPEIKIGSYLGVIAKAKKKRSGIIVGITGCVAQNLGEEILKKFSTVDFVMGTEAISKFSSILDRALSGERFVDISLNDGEFSIDEFKRDSSVSSYVTIMKGCDNYCSYCIVPYVRGREVSRGSIEIVDEVKRLVDIGVKEITLLGQNVNSYGKGLKEDITFAELLKKVDKVDGLKRIRFLTSHPKDIDKKLLETISDSDKICKYIHLPVQSGSDRILTLMNRGYTIDDYKRKIDYARNLIPDIGFSSDFIVGFPNETDDDFEKTLDIIRYVQYDHLFAFVYSKRRGTEASKMVDNIEDKIKSNRLKRLFELKDEIMDSKLSKLIGSRFKVMVTGRSKRNVNEYTGLNDANRNINFSSERELQVGDIVDIKITASKRNSLAGTLF